MPQSAYLLLLLAYDEPSLRNSHTVLRSDVSFGYIPRRWIDAIDYAMDATIEAHLSDPLKGTIHLLGARQQIIDNAAFIWRAKPPEKLRIVLAYADNTWRAILIVDDRSHGVIEPLLETGWHRQLITPDNAYMLLVILTSIKVHEKLAESNVFQAAEPEGSVRVAGSGEGSD